MTNDSHFIVILTDLDGTLLDQISYGWEDAKPALNLCKRLHIPVVPVSSKTGAEIDAIRRKLGLTSPFISENGGGIFFPAGGDYNPPSGTIIASDIGKWSLGLPYDFLVRAFKEIRNELGWKLRGFSEMTPEEISHLTGLDLKTSLLASEREYDEPFIVLEQDIPDINALHAAARRRGLKITIGGRFYHLQGSIDKGEAVRKILSWYQEYHSQLVSIALGDNLNDFSMLKQVNYPVLVRSSHQFPGIEDAIQGITITMEMGPKGWNTAVLDLLRNKIVTTQSIGDCL